MALVKISKSAEEILEKVIGKSAKAAANTAEEAVKIAAHNGRRLGKVFVGAKRITLKEAKQRIQVGELLNRAKKLSKESSNTHFDSTYKLKSNTTYKVKEYTYKTDHLGRIKSAEGNLKLKKGTRNTTHQRKAGGNDRLKNDDGGHLIGTRFDGSGKVDNIVPMNSNLNRGEFKKLENSWAKALKNGQTVEVKVTPVYKGDSVRPDSFKVTQIIDGIKSNKILKNKPGG